MDGSGLSPEAALDVIFNEADTLLLAEEIVHKENLDVDFQTCRKLEGRYIPELLGRRSNY